MKKTLASLVLTMLLLVILAPAVLAANGSSELEGKLEKIISIAVGLSRGIGIIGAIVGAAGLVMNPNPEGKAKFKTVLFGCILLALASTIVGVIFKL
jgi:type IV secretory pathway VirB2 component (pilin)